MAEQEEQESTVLNVLIVEDSELDRKVTQRALRSAPLAKYKLHQAETLEAAQSYAMQDDVFDVILLDLNLSDSKGLETLDLVQESFPEVPLVVLTGQAEAQAGVSTIAAGAQDYLMKEEITPSALGRSIRYATERMRLLNEIKTMALRDPLTGIYNRRYLYERGQAEFKTAKRYSHPLAAMMIDGDNFKRVNDTYGHQAGDEILQIVADRLRDMARENDLVARYGGEEFAALLPQTPLEGAVILAERMRENISEAPIKTSAGPVEFSLSIGVAPIDGEMNTLDEIFKSADDMLYKAKENGRNRVESPLKAEG